MRPTKLHLILAAEGLTASLLPPGVVKLDFKSQVDGNAKTTYEVIGTRPSTLIEGETMYRVQETHPRHGKRVVTMTERKWSDLVAQANDLVREGQAVVYSGRRASAKTAFDAKTQEALAQISDAWVDAAFDVLHRITLSDSDIGDALHKAGLKSEQVNSAAEGLSGPERVAAASMAKQAGALSTITALGGKVLGWAWHTLTHPFHMAWKMVTSPKAREEVKKWIKKVLHHEVMETKHMYVVARRVAAGEEVPRAEMVKAVHQFGDLLKTALIFGVLAHHFGPELIHDPLHVIAALASPADEVVGILLDNPLKMATKMLLGRAFGLLPTAFYEVL